MILERFLYEELSYTINTGKSPVVVNSEKVHNKISVPFVNWEINFGVIDTEFKNFLEENLLSSDSVDLITHICPAYRIIKNNSQQFYIYKHELDYYGSDKVDLRRLVDNSHTIAENFFDPVNLFLKPNLPLTHKVLFLQDSFQVTHKANGLLECRCVLKEYFKPTSLTYTVTGASYANDSIGC